MKARSTVIAVVLLGGTAALTVFALRERHHAIRLSHELAASDDRVRQLDAALVKARETIETQAQQLTELDANLGATKTRLTATESKNVQLSRETDQLRVQLKTHAETESHLTSKVAALKQSLALTNDRSASTGDVVDYQARITDLEPQLTDLRTTSRTAVLTAAQLSTPILTTSRGRTSSVVSVGPSNAFVVVNYGAAHGALPAQIMDIHRGTELIATVLISDVRENYSIAQVRPHSLRDSLHKGDSATLAP